MACFMFSQVVWISVLFNVSVYMKQCISVHIDCSTNHWIYMFISIPSIIYYLFLIIYNIMIFFDYNDLSIFKICIVLYYKAYLIYN